MTYQILFIQGAGEVTTQEERVIVDALKTELGDDFTILLPPIKDADNPTYSAWADALITNLNNLSGRVILLGHSFGASVILKHFSSEPVPDKVIGMILFGVPYWKEQNWDVTEYAIEDDFLDNLSKLDNICFYHSMDDEVIPYDQFKAYQKLIPKAQWSVLSGIDHSYHGAIQNMVIDIQKLMTNVKG
jgi:uncharacterized protein